jgi:arylsulfatase A-like enzyme
MNTEPLRARTIALFGLGFGLATGLGEVALRGMQRLRGSRTFLSADVVWMAPLADIALFLFLAVLLILLTARWKTRLRAPHLVFTVYLLFALIGPVLAYPRLHAAASVVLTLGVAHVVAGWLTRRPHLVRFAKPLLALGLATVVVLGVSVRGTRWAEERAALRALPAADLSRPNVLLLILDTVRAADLSAYGYEKPTTPTLEVLAAEGVLFERTFSTAPWTLTAHASMFTGRYPRETSADWLAPLDDRHPTIAERFAAEGYATGGFAANFIYTTRETGLQRGFSRYEDYPVSLPMVANSSLLARRVFVYLRRRFSSGQRLVRKSAADVLGQFERWRARHTDRPFFAFLNFMDAHAPFLPPPDFAGRFGPTREGEALWDLSQRQHWPAEELEAERAAYDGSIASIDREIGRALEALEAAGVLDNTIVVVTSDHGEQFGEHGLADHGNSLYRPVLEVPLIIRFPAEVPAGASVREPVSLRDLPATLLDVSLGREDLAGESLAPLWSRDPEHRPSPVFAEVSRGVRMPEWTPVMRGDMVSIVKDDFHYIRNGDGVEELFALEDVSESRDLAAEPDFQEALERVRAAADSMVALAASQ